MRRCRGCAGSVRRSRSWRPSWASRSSSRPMAHDELRRVVVTGFGPVTCVATGREAFWEGLLAGRNGIRDIAAFDTSALPVHIAGEVQDFEPERWMTTKEVRRTDRS